ncbi:MAG: hypothetical protein NTY00_00490 [Deltaproteobacteria bacterium]|nr:hypothetical protein [Deltaproteobacteria bacterium]
MDNKIAKFYMPCLFFFTFLFHCSFVSALTLDASFGKNGLVTTRVGHYVDKAQSVVVQPDGKILVAGSSSNNSNLDFALVRYLPDGSLDTSFHGNGQVVTVVGSGDDAALGIALQNDGKIVTCGYTFNGQDRDFALLRFTGNGDLDTDFGVNGIVTLPVGSGNDTAAAVTIQADGTILVAGSVEESAGKVGALVRFFPNGSLDYSFGKAGVVFVDVGSNAEIAAMAIQKDKSIVLTGSYEEKEQRKVLLVRLLPDGLPDTGFGVDGVAETLEGTRASTGNGLWLQGDGAILVAGSVGPEKKQDIALFQFTKEGRLNRDFGGGTGMLSYDKNGEDDVGYGVFANSTTLFVTGYTTVNGLRDLILLQYPLTQNSQSEFSVVTTGVSQFDGVAYALASQDSDKLISVGFSEESGISSFVLARYTGKEVIESKAGNSESGAPFILTTAITEITRVGCFTGGEIKKVTGLTFASRGVVYSIAPYPVLTSGGTDGTNDTTAPTLSNPVPALGAVLNAGTSEMTISLSTDENAQCRYSAVTGTAYLSMIPFETTGGITHSTLITGLQNGTSYSYSVKCEDQSGNINTSDYVMNFSVAQTGAKAISSSAKTTSTSESILSSSKSAVTTVGATTAATEGSTSNGAGTGHYSSILSGLTPGTHYYVRAYGVTSDNIVYYGNQLDFETKDACFIATAAYGSLLDPHVQILRLFRDKYLSNNESGRMFVRLYYHYSPQVAEFIAAQPALRLIVRIFLFPLIICGYIAVHAGITVMCMAMLAVLGTVVVGRKMIYLKK